VTFVNAGATKRGCAGSFTEASSTALFRRDIRR
jgi:hypothetical protein